MRRLLPALLLLVAVSAPAAADEDDRFADVTIEATPVGDGLAMLTGSGGNLAVSWGDDGIFLVDDQYAPLTDRILAAIAQLADGPVRFVFNTHWHGDHTGGNEHLGAAGSVIVSHDNVRRRLSREQVTTFFDRTTPASPHDALPVITFNDSLTFHLNGGTVRVFHVPHAHTDGDAVLHFADRNVIHAGDIVFYGLYPYIDIDAGGSIGGLIDGVRTILSLCDDGTKVIPGHGPLLERAQVQEYLVMLEAARTAVAEAARDGADLATVLARKPTSPWDEAWGQTWLTGDQFTELVYRTLDGPLH